VQSATAEDLAVMSATLADGGVNPVTGRRAVTPAVCQQVLAVMATAGMYETSGEPVRFRGSAPRAVVP
jgi:glutaminase